jgi:polyisoprenoid-binding protein YceI
MTGGTVTLVRSLSVLLLVSCAEPRTETVSAASATGFALQSLDAPAAAAVPAGGPVTYKLDPVKSWIYVVVYNDKEKSLTPGYGHDHGIRPKTFDGTVVWDAADPFRCKVGISFRADSMYVDPPGMREREGLPADGAVEDGAKETIRGNFLDSGQLDAQNHPTISYKSTSCTAASGKFTVTGNLTMRGVTKPVSTTMTVTPTPTSFVASGVFRAKATDFGFKPYSAPFGFLKNRDEMKFVVDVVGTPAR